MSPSIEAFVLMNLNIKTPQYYDTQHNDIQQNVAYAKICNQAHYAECLYAEGH